MAARAPSPTPAVPRRSRERELVMATRALWDERGMQDVPIEQIARAVGIARGLVYRHFSSKEELFVLTVTTYLDELDGELREAIGGAGTPVEALEATVRCFAAYCALYPAFLDGSMSLMRRPALELREIVSELVWLRLGQAMARCLDQVAGYLRWGVQTGAFAVEDPEVMANFQWTQMLGALHLARIGVAVRQVAPGVPGLVPVDDGAVVEQCVRSALAAVRA